MANQLDLEEQEQLEQLKHFWAQYGNLITWLLIAVLSVFAAWNGYQYWQRNQAAQAAALFDELERVAGGKDIAKLDRVLGDMKDKFPSTSYAQQAALLAAKVYFEADKADQAKSNLTWVAEKSSDSGYQAIARLRLAGILLESKAFDEALKQLGNTFPHEFAALVADRRGDVYLAQGKKSEAGAEFLKAYQSLDEGAEYRRLVEVKLASLGLAVPASKLDSAGAKK